jgi:hypothetical protein
VTFVLILALLAGLQATGWWRAARSWRRAADKWRDAAEAWEDRALRVVRLPDDR